MDYFTVQTLCEAAGVILAPRSTLFHGAVRSSSCFGVGRSLLQSSYGLVCDPDNERDQPEARATQMCPLLLCLRLCVPSPRDNALVEYVSGVGSK